MKLHLPIELASDAPEALALDEIELSQRHQRSIYDAAYLARAKSRGLLVATLDEQLARAATSERRFFAA